MAIRTLLVDDERAIREIFAALLAGDGFDIETAGSAAEAIERLTAQDFDLVVTDMRMETATAGFDVVQAAKACANSPAVVIMTAYPMQGSEWRRAGADALMMKVMNTGELGTKFREIVEARQRVQPAPQAATRERKRKA